MPSVSIITPCYNVERYLPETVASVLGQTLTAWEHVLVNDGSTDGTGALADRLASRDERVRVIHQSNAGAAAARLTGYRASAPSNYLLFLDGDDALEPSMLETLTRYLDARPHVGVVICNRQHMDETSQSVRAGWHPTRWTPGALFPRRLNESTPETPFATLFVQDAISSPSATLIRRATYDQTRGWDPDFGKLFEDWDLVFQLALTADVHYFPEPLTRYRWGRPGQATATNASLGKVMYERLYDRWSRYEGVPKDKARVLRDAVAFREGRVLPWQNLVWAMEDLKHGRPKDAAWSFARAARYAALYLVRNLDGTYRQRFRDASE